MGSSSTSRPFPGFSRTYWLREPASNRYFRASLELHQNPIKITRGEESPVLPVTASWAMGSKTPADVIRTLYAVPVLISDRVLDLLRRTGFTGWSTYAIELHGHEVKRIPGYNGLSVHGRCGPLDNSRSVPTLRQFPARVSRVWKGLYFDEATWDGSDIFMPEGGGGWIFLVESVKRALERAKVKNVAFTPLDEVERLQL